MTLPDKSAREAALNPHQSFIVQAPAGSGKTELLIQRFLVLLAHVEKSPEEIIAITFTRKAAAEMRQRIIDALEAAKLPAPNEAHAKQTWELAQAALKRDQEKNWQLLENPHRLQIQTIDSLCANLVRRMPLSAGFGGTPNTLEDPKECYLAAARQLIAGLENDEPHSQSIAHLLSHLNNDVALLENLLVDMLWKRDQWLPHIMSQSHHSSFRDMLENSLNRVVEEALIKCDQAIPEHFREEIISLLQFAAHQLSISDPEHPIAACKECTSFPKPDAADYSTWLAISLLLLTDGEWRKTVDKRHGFPTDEKSVKNRMIALLKALSEKDELREYLSSLQNCPSTKYTDAQWQITTALLSVLPLLVAELNVAFDEKNVSDFTEITLAAIRALGELDTPSELALILDYQIRHLLIDEFQDTSSTQARLLMHLTHGWENHDGRTLFLVGDPMQSIYRFREAEVGLFLKTQQEGLGNISLTPLFLKANFRSTPHIVDWINQHFAYIFPTVPDISSGAVTYNPSFSTKTEVPNSGVYIHACRNEQTPSIIDIIQKERHAFPENSIALLVRSRAHLLDIVPALKNARIAFTAVEIEALNHQPIVHDLLALTTALIHLSDRVAWLAILRAPWCGLTLHDLYAVAGQNHHLLLWEVLQTFNDLPNLSNDGKIRLSKVVPILALSIQQRQRLTLRTWITQTWKALNGPQCLQNEHEHAIADTFFTTLESLEIAGDLPDVAQLSQKINTQFATPQNISKHALHIMTIHKAKGLEFDTVIIPHLDRKNKNESERLLRWLDRPRAGGDNDLILAPIKPRDEKQDNIYRYLHLTETQKINYEMARLFYVATTRSKKNLHLLATINDDNKKPGKSSFLSLIPQVFEEKISPLTFESLSTIEQDAPIEKLFYRLPTNVMHGHYTHHQQDNSQNKVSQVSDKQDHVGALARKILQNISQTNIDSWTPEKILTEQASWKRWLSTKGIELCDLKASVEKVTHIITQTLSDPRGRWILAPKVEHATELTLSTITNRGLIHLVIDRTFIDDEGTRWIIDYKTDSPTRGENIEDFLNQRQSTYRNQLEMYASALAQMDNRPISLGIYFPAFCGWKAWSYEGPSASTSKLSAMS